MVAPRVSSDEEDSDLIRHSLPKDTAAQEVISTSISIRFFRVLFISDYRYLLNIKWKS